MTENDEGLLQMLHHLLKAVSMYAQLCLLTVTTVRVPILSILWARRFEIGAPLRLQLSSRSPLFLLAGSAFVWCIFDGFHRSYDNVRRLMLSLRVRCITRDTPVFSALSGCTSSGI